MGNFVSQGAIAGRLTQHLATKYTIAEPIFVAGTPH